MVEPLLLDVEPLLELVVDPLDDEFEPLLDVVEEHTASGTPNEVPH